MDWLTFVAKLVEALAWPAATVVLVLLLRNEIHELVPFIKKLKAGPVEAEFERDVEALKEAVPEPLTEPPAPAKLDTTSKGMLIQLAELHPRSAILESWARLEAAARAALHSQVASASSYVPAARLAEPLVQQEIITQGQVTLFHELRRLRNDIAHAPQLEPSVKAATAYVDMASFLQSHLEGVKR